MCDRYSDPDQHDNEDMWATPPEFPIYPVDLITIEGSLGDHAIAHDLVERGHALVARVTSIGFVSFEAYRLSPTSPMYAWRTSAMSAPAFMPVLPDDRPGVYGMPRWKWDLFLRRGVTIS